VTAHGRPGLGDQSGLNQIEQRQMFLVSLQGAVFDIAHQFHARPVRVALDRVNQSPGVWNAGKFGKSGMEFFIGVKKGGCVTDIHGEPLLGQISAHRRQIRPAKGQGFNHLSFQRAANDGTLADLGLVPRRDDGADMRPCLDQSVSRQSNIGRPDGCAADLENRRDFGLVDHHSGFKVGQDDRQTNPVVDLRGDRSGTIQGSVTEGVVQSFCGIGIG